MRKWAKSMNRPFTQQNGKMVSQGYKKMFNIVIQPVRMAEIKNSSSTQCWRGSRETGPFLYCWCECKMAQALWKPVWLFLTKPMQSPYGPAITLLGIYPREMKTCVHIKPVHLIYISPKVESAQMSFDRWVVKHSVVYPYHEQHREADGRNVHLVWIFRGTMPSEWSQAQSFRGTWFHSY